MSKPEYTQDNIDRLTEEVTQHFYNNRYAIYMSNKERFEDDWKILMLDEIDLEREIEEIEVEATGGMSADWTFDTTDDYLELEDE